MSYLNLQNIKRSGGGVEYHPLHPFLPHNAKVLFLGSFPPQRKRWCMDFFYPNFINDHWRIEGEVFHNDKDFFVESGAKRFVLPKIIEHCQEHGIAFFDTATAVRRLQDNASDKFLEVVEQADVRAIVAALPLLKAIVTTGEKATDTICNFYGIANKLKVNSVLSIDDGLELYRLPSSSRAYPMAFGRKADAYRAMFLRYGMLRR